MLDVGEPNLQATRKLRLRPPEFMAAFWSNVTDDSTADLVRLSSRHRPSQPAERNLLPQKVRNPNEEPMYGHKLVGFRWSPAKGAEIAGFSSGSFFSINLLGVFIGYHAVGTTSCGNGFKLA
jgi:hypothetical protein